MWLNYQDPEQEEVDVGSRRTDGGWLAVSGGSSFLSLSLSLLLVISYLWIYLDTGECCCTNFKHYLILQTSLLMLQRSEAQCGALAKLRWQQIHMCVSVRFQRGGRKKVALV